MTLHLDDGDVKLYHGHTVDVLRALPAASVDCIVTSPPYYGLRDYGTGTWTGGDPACPHQAIAGRAERPRNGLTGGTATVEASTIYRDACGKCGARRIDQQIGLEETPALFLERLVGVFRECRRVLADHGTLWVNLGDSYTTGGSDWSRWKNGQTFKDHDRSNARPTGLPSKSLLGMPWRLAFALQDDGWILRRDIIWAKPNPMPESVTDRCTSAHEYVFHLVKRARYAYDADAVREPAQYGRREWSNVDDVMAPVTGARAHGATETARAKATVKGSDPSTGRNLRSVWEIATQPTPEAHFATYPEELVRRCILAGCPLEVCRECGKPRERLTNVTYGKSPVHGAGSVVGRHYETGANNYDGAGMPRLAKRVETLGWTDCGHDAYRRGVVLDPFIGSGTTCKVARDHGRHAIGIDLNAEYLAIAARRLQQLSLLGGDAA